MLPRHRKQPLTMIARRPHRASHSSMLETRDGGLIRENVVLECIACIGLHAGNQKWWINLRKTSPRMHSLHWPQCWKPGMVD